MSGPAQVRVKRKRDERGPETLILAESNKRILTPESYVQYVRKQDSSYDLEVDRLHGLDNSDNAGGKYPARDTHVQQQSSNVSHGNSMRRTFHLSRSVGATRKKATKAEAIATFTEKKRKRGEPANSLQANEELVQSSEQDHEEPVESFKRPGRGSTMKKQQTASITAVRAPEASPNDQLLSLADELHRYALDEAVPKPKITATPRLPPHRSRELHRQHVSTTNEPRIRDDEGDEEMGDDSDYVYDTYVLTSSALNSATAAGPAIARGDVGYLIIAEEDQSMWETYMEDEPSDDDTNNDEEDENAEDHYGADYPEDELASDDEYDRNAYSYRGHAGSDDEEYDEDTGAYSDNEGNKAMSAWKKRVAAAGASGTHVDDEENDS